MKYIDQTSDKSGATIVKLASRMEDQDLAKRVLNVFFDPNRDREHEGQMKTAEDTLLSSVYFEGQKHNLPYAEVERMQTKLAALKTLFEIRENFSMRPEKIKKTASEFVESPRQTMKKIAEILVDRHGNGETYGTCSKAAALYTKLASEVGEDVPDSIKLYSLDGLEKNAHIIDNIRLHKYACLRNGLNHKAYTAFMKQANAIGNDDVVSLRKLALAIDNMDADCNIRNTISGKHVPNGLETVFQVKQAQVKTAEEQDDQTKNMDKAQIVARFGENSLNEIENPDGTINQDRLKAVNRLFGGSDGEGSSTGNASE